MSFDAASREGKGRESGKVTDATPRLLRCKAINIRKAPAPTIMIFECEVDDILVA